jgi:hypothetical protein
MFYWKEARIPIILFSMQYAYPKLTSTAATYYSSDHCVHYHSIIYLWIKATTQPLGLGENNCYAYHNKSCVVLQKGSGGRQSCYIWSHSVAEKTQFRNTVKPQFTAAFRNMEYAAVNQGGSKLGFSISEPIILPKWHENRHYLMNTYYALNRLIITLACDWAINCNILLIVYQFIKSVGYFLSDSYFIR